ncbi:hypothetical protein VSQ48_07080 [Candidatus Ventrimonas sp. KK005]
MRKSLKVLAAATAMTMLLSSTAFAETVAKPGEWTELTTSGWAGEPIKIRVQAYTTTFDEVANYGTFGAYNGSDYGEQEDYSLMGVKSAIQIEQARGYTPYHVILGEEPLPGQDDHYLSTFCVMGTDVKSYRELKDEAEKQSMFPEDPWAAPQALKGEFILSWNGVDYPCHVYRSAGWHGSAYTIFLPNGYTGDVSFNFYPILWKGASYSDSSVQTLEGFAKAFASSTKADHANRIECYITGSKVQPKPEGWHFEYETNAQNRRERAVDFYNTNYGS